MASVFRRKGCRHWRIAWTDATGERHEANSKKLNKKDALQLAADVERGRVPVPGAKDGGADKSFAEAVDEYLADLERRGLSREYLDASRRLLRRFRAGRRGVETVADFVTAEVTGFLSGLAGRSPRSTNEYRGLLASFGAFVVAQGWLDDNPVTRVRRARSGAPRRPKRAFTADELARFLAAANDRHRLAYRVAALSGLRRKELARLRCGDFVLGERPRWKLRAEATKARRADTVPMLPECAELLGEFAKREPTARVFGVVPCPKSFDGCLERSGVNKVDAAGKSLSFHSLRYTFCRLLDAAGVRIQVVKKLMRHKNLKETADLYGDLGLEDVEEALESLPRLGV